MWTGFFILLLSMLAVMEVAGQVNSEALNLYKNSFDGDATYYGGTGGVGSCSFGIPGPAMASQTKMAAALNQPQFLGSLMCGSCWRVIGSGHGGGNDPVTGNFIIYVDDLCPGCQAGDVDLGVNGDGRWDVNIQAIQCPVGNGNLEYRFQGSNAYFIKLQVRNTRLPVHILEVEHNGWHKANHGIDGFFLYSTAPNGPIDGSFQVRLTAVNGVQVTDTVSSITNDVVIHGNVQFPIDNTLPQ